jgi:uncharacterized protein with von Willebrand factor type A (vWA) domain
MLVHYPWSTSTEALEVPADARCALIRKLRKSGIKIKASHAMDMGQIPREMILICYLN